MTNKEYDILTVLDFTKVPKSKVKKCLKEFAIWIEIMREAKKTNVLIPVDKFRWIDDTKQEIRLSILVPSKKTEVSNDQ